jgi:hypothetical protein
MQVEEIDDAQLDAELDAEMERGNAAMQRLGMSDVEIARVRGRSVEDAGQPTLASIERELKDLNELRRTDPKSYWSDEQQARGLKLIEQQQKLANTNKAEAPTAKAEHTAPADVSDDGEEPLDVDALPLPESLKAEWRKSPGGIEDAVAAIRSRAGTIMSSLGDEDGEGLMRSFDDDLGEEEQVAICASLAEDSGRWPVASERRSPTSAGWTMARSCLRSGASRP